MNPFVHQFKLEWLHTKRQPRPVLNACLFLAMMSIFFPLTLPAESLILKQALPGFFWMTMLLSILLASERLFQPDYEEGIIEQWIVSGHALWMIVAGKLSLQWIVLALPFCMFVPVMILMFDLSLSSGLCLFLSILAATPGMFCLTALAAALGTGLQQKGMLMALLILPLNLPFLMMGSSALSASIEGFDFSAQLAVLAALSLIAVSALPFVIAFVIRISLVD